MLYLQQKDSTWETRRPSSTLTRYTRSRRRQSFAIFALLCVLIYWTVCAGLGDSKNLFTPSVPATPDFFAGGSEDRLVTIQASRGPVAVSDSRSKEEQLITGPINPSQNAESPDAIHANEQYRETLPNVVQVTRGSSVNDIGDVEEQQAVVEDVSQLQPVVTDGGRLTDISRSQVPIPSGDFDISESGRVASSLGLPQAQDKDQKTLDIAEPMKYVLPDPSNFDKLNRLADELPDFVHVPLHMAVKDETLDDWEEDWFAYARYDAATHGKISEPKIDFVYTCEYELLCTYYGLIGNSRGQWLRYQSTLR